MIYLDNAATSWPKPEDVYQAVNDCLRNIGGSPGRSGHTLARAANQLVFEAREELAALFNISSSDSIAFTYNATDALNTALFGLLNPGDTVVTTSMEHNAVARPLRVLEAKGINLKIVNCTESGQLELESLHEALADGARAVVMSHGSNVTGGIMPVAKVGRLAKEAGALLIIDAAQTAGSEEIDVAAMNIDLLAFSGHKGLLGPQGIGGLYMREDLAVTPLRFGGTGSQSESDLQPEFYPDRLESGTPNTPGIAGLLAGVRYIRKTGVARIKAHEQALTEQLFAGLSTIPGVTVYGPADEPRTAVVSFNIAGMDSMEVSYRLDREFKIASRAGLHCAPWAHQTIGTIKTGTIRLSPGLFNTPGDIIAAIEAVCSIAAGRG